MHLFLKYNDTKSLVRIALNFLGFANSVLLRMRRKVKLCDVWIVGFCLGLGGDGGC
jgi:hypothetical protein